MRTLLGRNRRHCTVVLSVEGPKRSVSQIDRSQSHVDHTFLINTVQVIVPGHVANVKGKVGDL